MPRKVHTHTQEKSRDEADTDLSKADGGGRRLVQGGCKLSLSNLMRLQLIVEGNLGQLARFISAASEDFVGMRKNRRGKWRRRSKWRMKM